MRNPTATAQRRTARSTRPASSVPAGDTSVPPALRAAVRRNLLRWYDRNRRDLPWRRRAADPYAQWVAEVMLQQTRVETVIEYYERFLRRFPTHAALAAANHDEVLTFWAGLGYYRRILHLHRAAQQLCREAREIPGTAAEWRRLPGVGEYTAGAIASIAFGERVPAVDGNVARVLARLFGIGENVLSPIGRRRITHIAGQFVPARRPGDFNQAWMDLGSLICTPQSPRCDQCPLERVCVAQATGQVDRLPLRGNGAAGPVPEVTLVVAVFASHGRMLLRRRATGGLWSGLWEFPNAPAPAAGPMDVVLSDMARESDLGLTAAPVALGTVVRRLTHRLIRLHAYICEVAAPARRAGRAVEDRRWVDPDGLARMAVSTAQRRVFALARAALGWQPRRSPRRLKNGGEVGAKRVSRGGSGVRTVGDRPTRDRRAGAVEVGR
ncbi:MAG: A/G-specific adenine glycosylase [Planctomycetes bacterium]|nr:A/G-specific adenine glycosylase [Planctomycetota bacterium]